MSAYDHERAVTVGEGKEGIYAAMIPQGYEQAREQRAWTRGEMATALAMGG